MSTSKPTTVPYSASIRAGDFVFTAGQVPRDANRNVVGSNIGEQTAVVFERLRKALEAQGASLSQVVKVQVFLADMGDWPKFNEEYARQMDGRSPPRTTVGADLNGVLVEIDVIAYAPLSNDAR